MTVLDVAPPPLRRRGAGAARAAELSTMDGVPDLADELRRRTVARADDLRRMGVPVTGEGWLVDDVHRARLRPRVVAEVERYAAAHPLDRARRSRPCGAWSGCPTGHSSKRWPGRPG